MKLREIKMCMTHRERANYKLWLLLSVLHIIETSLNRKSRCRWGSMQIENDWYEKEKKGKKEKKRKKRRNDKDRGVKTEVTQEIARSLIYSYQSIALTRCLRRRNFSLAILHRSCFTSSHHRVLSRFNCPSVISLLHPCILGRNKLSLSLSLFLSRAESTIFTIIRCI